MQAVGSLGSKFALLWKNQVLQDRPTLSRTTLCLLQVEWLDSAVNIMKLLLNDTITRVATKCPLVSFLFFWVSLFWISVWCADSRFSSYKAVLLAEVIHRCLCCTPDPALVFPSGLDPPFPPARVHKPHPHTHPHTLPVSYLSFPSFSSSDCYQRSDRQQDFPCGRGRAVLFQWNLRVLSGLVLISGPIVLSGR